MNAKLFPWEENFERFALDHEEHAHCIGCGGCLLTPSFLVQCYFPVWCVACRERIKKQAAVTGRRLPWTFEL